MDFADSFFDKDQFGNFGGGNEFEQDYPFFDKFPFQTEESSIPGEDIHVQQNKEQPNLSTFTIPEIPIPSQVAGSYGLQITSANIESHSAPLQVVATPISSSFEKQEQDLCSSTSSLRITPLPDLPLTNLPLTSQHRRNSLDHSNDSTSIPLLCNNQSPLSSPRGEPTSPRGIDSTVTTKEKKSEAKKDKKDKKDKMKGDKKEKQNLKLQRGSKNRLKWTPELITLFQNAVKKLGAGAVPSAILEEMNVKGLSRENVASHLQKYRLQNKKVPPKDNTDDILYPEEKEQLKTMSNLDLHEKYMEYHRRYTMPPPPGAMAPPHMSHGHPPQHHGAPPPYYCYNCTRRYSLPGCSLDQAPPPHTHGHPSQHHAAAHTPTYHVNKYDL